MRVGTCPECGTRRALVRVSNGPGQGQRLVVRRHDPCGRVEKPLDPGDLPWLASQGGQT